MNTTNEITAWDFNSAQLPYYNQLYKTALRMTRSVHEAEDLLQETFLKAYRYYDGFEEGTLGACPRVGRRVIDRPGEFRCRTPVERLDPDDPLAHRRQQQVRRQELRHAVLPAEANRERQFTFGFVGLVSLQQERPEVVMDTRCVGRDRERLPKGFGYLGLVLFGGLDDNAEFLIEKVGKRVGT